MLGLIPDNLLHNFSRAEIKSLPDLGVSAEAGFVVGGVVSMILQVGLNQWTNELPLLVRLELNQSVVWVLEGCWVNTIAKSDGVSHHLVMCQLLLPFLHFIFPYFFLGAKEIYLSSRPTTSDTSLERKD